MARFNYNRIQECLELYIHEWYTSREVVELKTNTPRNVQVQKIA